MFTDELAHKLAAAATAAAIDPPGLVALVEVETQGRAFEQDGRTPQFLFERHIAEREAARFGARVLAAFRRAGLALPKWSPATQYRDQRTSAQRLALIGRARLIHAECADRSASWGLPQIMGNAAESLGYANAQAMVAAMTGDIDAQIDCMVRFVKHKGIARAINDGNAKRVALLYNGAGFAKNRYDVKWADARARWARKLALIAPGGKPRPLPPEQALAKDEVEAVQSRLRDLGFPQVGRIDGRWGDTTTGALAAFQAHAGLPVTGHYDDATKAALDAAEVPREVAPERSAATADDLRADGSQTIAAADSASLLGKLKAGGGALIVGGGAADSLIGNASSALDKADQAKGLFERVHDYAAPLLADPRVLVLGAVLLIGGLAVVYFAERVIARRVADHRSGVHAGS